MKPREAHGQSSATDDAIPSSGWQQQQSVAMVISDNDDDDVPPDYDDTADNIYHRRLSVIRAEMTGAGTSGSTLASDVAAENTSLLTLSFVGSAPVPPPYRRYTMATDATGWSVHATYVYLALYKAFHHNNKIIIIRQFIRRLNMSESLQGRRTTSNANTWVVSGCYTVNSNYMLGQ